MPSKTLLGQVATFMESLHLSYDEVVHRIPYRVMLLMLKDKQHVCYGDVWDEVSEEEYFRNRK